MRRRRREIVSSGVLEIVRCPLAVSRVCVSCAQSFTGRSAELEVRKDENPYAVFFFFVAERECMLMD